MEPLIVVSDVSVKDKGALIAEFGEDDFGNPKSSVGWNELGKMEHLFGARGKIATISNEGGWATITFENQIPGKDYDWSLGLDVLTSSRINKPAPDAIKLRKFLESVKGNPSHVQVWNALKRLQTKEKMPEGQILFLFEIYQTVKYDVFKTYITTSAIKDIKSQNPTESVLHTATKFYPGVNPTTLELVVYLLEKPNLPYYDSTIEMLEKLKITKQLLEEFNEDNILLPIRRTITGASTLINVDKIWNNLEFTEGSLDVSSQKDLQKTISKAVVKYLNKNKLRSIGTSKIKVEL